MRRFIPVVLAVMLLALVLPGTVAARPPTGGALTRAVSGTVTATGQPWTGDLTVNRFAVQDGKLVAIGSITNVLVDGTPRLGTQPVAIPVDTAASGAGSMQALQASAACDILSLVLGPLHLDLLGLVVDLNEVHLDITAVPGAGNLLGNLLCAVAGLLDGPGTGPLAAIANLLNQILGILQGL